jgi:hypothetical protein
MKKPNILSIAAAVSALSMFAAPAFAGSLTATGPVFNPTSSFGDSTVQVQVIGGNLARASGNVTVSPPSSGTTASMSMSGNYSATAGELASSAYSFIIGANVSSPLNYKVTGSAVVLGTQQNFETTGQILPGLHQYKGKIKSGKIPVSTSGTYSGTITFDFASTSTSTKAAAAVTAPGTLNARIEQFDFQIATTEVNTFAPSQPLNISTRLDVETGDNVLIGGFIVTGTDDKKVIVRAIGPSLPVSGALANPTLELHDGSGALLAVNDDWKSDQQSEIQASGVPPTNDFESAIVQTLPANNAAYTAILRGKDGGTGIGLVEVYDLGQSANSRLANISTRGFVQTADDVMIGGFILGPTGTTGASSVVVRAIGPSLPVAGALQDPSLELRDINGDLVASNDNWMDGADHQQIADKNLAPTQDKESALLAIPSPGNYTAIVRGVGSTTGVGLVEVYHLQ